MKLKFILINYLAETSNPIIHLLSLLIFGIIIPIIYYVKFFS